MRLIGHREVLQNLIYKPKATFNTSIFKRTIEVLWLEPYSDSISDQHR